MKLNQLKSVLKGLFAGVAAAFGLSVGAVELPKDYTAVDYIVAPNGAYIDTDYKPNQNTRVVMDVLVQGERELWFGCCDRPGGGRFVYDNGVFAFGNSGCIYAGYDDNNLSSDSAVQRGRHMVELDGNIVKVDGNVRCTFPKPSFQLTNTLYLFALNRNGRVFVEETQPSIICYGCTISENGELKRNFVPCFPKINPYSPGLYETVEGKFYEHQGSGVFLVNSVPAGYTAVDHIAVPRGSYIDTGYRVNSETRVEMNVTVQSKGEYWFGCWDRNYNDGAFAFGNDGSGFYAGHGNEGGTFGSVVSNGRHKVGIDKNVVKVDEKEIHSFNRGYFTISSKLYFFAQNRNGAIGVHDSQTFIICHGCRIYGSSDKYEFVPCISPTGQIGLYDWIGQRFYALQTGLPSDYMEVDRIVVPRGAFIDTGYKPNQNSRTVMDVTVQGAGEYWFGCWDEDYNRGAYALGNDGDMGVYFGMGNTGGSYKRSSTGGGVPPGRHTVEIDSWISKFDGEKSYDRRDDDNPDLSDFQLKNNLYLFAQNRNGTLCMEKSQNTIICHGCAISEGETPKRVFVPCVRTADAVAGLYDMVEGTFYGASGTGNVSTFKLTDPFGHELTNGTYEITESFTYVAPMGESALKIADGATVTLNIPWGVTVALRGGDAVGMTGAGAGIEVPANATLKVTGAGKLVACGGRAANGADGFAGGNGSGDKDTGYFTSGAGGAGGAGGGGAGAGIGGRGGNGGAGGAGGASVTSYNWEHTDRDGNAGRKGGDGWVGGTCGTVSLEGMMTVVVCGGAGAADGAGGHVGERFITDGSTYYFGAYGGGGGGSGAKGGAAQDIGGGGGGGFGGGGGGSGAYVWGQQSTVRGWDGYGRGGIGANYGMSSDFGEHGGAGGAAGAPGALGGSGSLAIAEFTVVRFVSGASDSYSVGRVSGTTEYIRWEQNHLYRVVDGVRNELSYSVVSTSTSTFEDGKWYVVKGTVSMGSINVSGAANLVLLRGASLTTSGGNYSPGVWVTSGNTLNIYGEESGSLTATGGDYGAGIGGGYFGNGGTVTINGGVVTAQGNRGGAGIGGGYFGNGGTVTINGGTVTAQGGDAAGIGAGNGGNGGSLTLGPRVLKIDDNHWREGVAVSFVLPVGVRASTVGADKTCMEGDRYFAVSLEPGRTMTFTFEPDPGCRLVGNASLTVGPVVRTYELEPSLLPHAEEIVPDSLDYVLPDGEVRSALNVRPVLSSAAMSVLSQAWYYVTGELSRPELTVTGEVNLILCDDALLTVNGGIRMGPDDTLNIFCQRGGTGRLVANGFKDCAGIGGSEYGTGGTVTINGGTVTATGGGFGAGIGGGDYGAGGTVTINGGTVTAKGGEKGAGIGGGYGDASSGGPNSGAGGTVTINGGTVTATGGAGGAGIGGGNSGRGGEVTINGGVVTATGGTGIFDHGITYLGGGAGIGGGNRGAGGNVTINGGTVTAQGNDGGAGIGGGNKGADGEVTLGGAVKVVEGAVGNASSYVWITIASIMTVPAVENASLTVTMNGAPVVGFAGGELVVPSNTTVTVDYTVPAGWVLRGETHFEATVVSDLRLPAEGHEPTALWQTTYLAPETNEVGEITFVERGTNALIVTEATDRLENGWYVVTGTVSRAGLDLPANVTANLILADGASLMVTGCSHGAGIDIRLGETLNIYGQQLGTGRLMATGGEYGAGIGSGYDSNGGAVTINGGSVTAIGGFLGAGIGGGADGAGGTVVIVGGTVTATGDINGAGIGGGYCGRGGEVIVLGGTVTATGGKNASGIGCGYPTADGGAVTINDGRIKAVGDGYGVDLAGRVELSGGIFGMTVAPDWLGDGYCAVANPDAETKEDYPCAVVPLFTVTVPAVGGATVSVTTNGAAATDFAGGELVVPLGTKVTVDYTETEGWTLRGETHFEATVEGDLRLPSQGDEPRSLLFVSYLSPETNEVGEITFVEQGTNALVVTEATDRFEDGWHVVTGKVSRAGIVVAESCTANLILADGASLTATGGLYCAGVDVWSNGVLNVYCQQLGTGRLTATGGSFGAGIGGRWHLNAGGRYCGVVTINGGTVTATGGYGSAGIGGGNDGVGATVTINAGTVAATGGTCGAGIGGGEEGAGGTVTVNGGVVTATSGEYGAGIGGGGSWERSGGAGGMVTINGGVVTATGDGAGIGGGRYGAGGEVTVNGGLVTAKGGVVGIGGCIGGEYGSVTLGEKVVAVEGAVGKDSHYVKLLIPDEWATVTVSDLDHKTAAWTFDGGAVTYAIDGMSFLAKKDWENVTVIFTADPGHCFAGGALTAEVPVGRVEADCTVTAPETRGTAVETFGRGWYVTATNGVYVDTLFKPGSNTRVEMDVLVGNTQKREYWFGCWTNDWNNGAFALGNDYNNKDEVYCGYGSGASCGGIPGIIPSGRVTVALEKGVVYTDGVVWSAAHESDAEFTLNRDLYLFAQNRNGTAKPGDGQERIVCYGCKIWTNGVNGAAVPVRNFVPARTKDDQQVVGLYDTVSGEFFAPRGGTLTLGYDENIPVLVTLGELPAHVTAAWTSGDGSVTNAIAGGVFKVLKGTENVKVVFIADPDYSFAEGAVSAEVVLGRVDEDCLVTVPEVRKSEVEQLGPGWYVAAENGAYIDTGLKARSNTRIVADMQALDLTAQCGFFGTIGGEMNLAAYINGWDPGLFATCLGKDKDYTVSGVTADAARHLFVLDANNGGSFVIDGTNVSCRVNNVTADSESTYNILIGARNQEGAAGTMNCRIFKFQIDEGGTSVRNFVPARMKDARQIVGLYDTVTGEFFSSRGGTLTLGYDENIQVIVTLGKLPAHVNAAWASGDGSVTNAIAGGAFKVLKGTENVKVVFIADPEYSFAEGAVAAEVGLGRVDEDCTVTVPEVRKSEIETFGPGWYVTATNGVYVDTLFKPGSNTRVEMDVLVGDTQKREYWFGCWDVNWNDRAFALGNDVVNVYCGYGSGSTCGGIDGLIPSGRVTVALEKGVVYTNGVVWSAMRESDAEFTLNRDLYLFAQNRNGTAKPGDGQERIVCYGCKIWTNGVNGAAVPVRNFVPARTKDARQIVGLYDTVSGEFFAPRGDSLTLGHDEDAAVSVTPGVPVIFDTAAEATNAAKNAVLTPTSEVEAKLGKGSDELDTYCKMFEFDVVPTSDDKWAVEAFLTPADWTNVVESAQAATRQIPVAKLAVQEYGTPLKNVPLTNCVPGFYYSLYDGSTVTNVLIDLNPTNRNILCGPGTTVTIPVLSQPSSASGFFAIGVLGVPMVYIPGTDYTITGGVEDPFQHRRTR